MRILRAEAMGFCFGVRDALHLAARITEPRSVTIHGELVHNEAVLVQLESRGFHTQPEAERERLPETPRVLVTAHGISDRERARLEAAGKTLIDTTCPLVRRVHQAARRLAAEGRHVVVIGKPGHVEVRGIVEDLESCEVIPNVAAVRCFEFARLGIVCQSTTPPRVAAEVVAAIRAANPHAAVRFVDTICQPTRDRQHAVERLLAASDLVIVVGGRNSNNTRALVELCREQGRPVFHVQSPDDLRAEWFVDVETVGLTAGTSTPDEIIERVHQRLLRISEEFALSTPTGVHG